MSAHEQKIDTRCPSCRTKYRLPAAGVGRRVRCVKCQAVFRIPEPRLRPPTEEDILAWLNEGMDRDDRWTTVRAAEETSRPSTQPAAVSPDSSVETPAHPKVVDQPGRGSSRVRTDTRSDIGFPAGGITLRKTG